MITTQINTDQFAQFLTANGFEVKVTNLGIVHGTVETARGELEVFMVPGTKCTDARMHAYKPNGKRADYWAVTDNQARARVRQLLKANSTAWC